VIEVLRFISCSQMPGKCLALLLLHYVIALAHCFIPLAINPLHSHYFQAMCMLNPDLGKVNSVKYSNKNATV